MRTWTALLALIALLACSHADDSSTVEAKKSAGCKTALDLIASQNPRLPMHPVFQEILNSPSLKGTLFVPTTKAWDDFFATVVQRQGNPEAPAMVARYGQVMLYHLAQDVNVPIALPTPGANKFAFDTASTLQCSVGPSLPNNRVIVKKTPQAIILEHGTGNASIVSQPIKYCGGEAYLVDQVLLPCSDVSAIMGEIANVPSPCKNNIEGVLHRNGISYYNALLLATGVSRPIFNAVRNFTIFAPSDAAIQAAYDAGTFNYPEMFAKNKDLLTGVVAYHTVPQEAFMAPDSATLTMNTLINEPGNGKAGCATPVLSWRPDGFVYGGTGAARVSNTFDRGCAAVIFQIDSLLQPCCKPMKDLLEGMKAPKGSMTEKALSYLKSKVKDGTNTRPTFIMPSEAAWKALMDDAEEANVTLSPAQIDAIISYLYTDDNVADVVADATPTKTALAGSSPKSLKSICKKGTNATIIFAYDTAAAGPTAGTADAAAAAPAATTGSPTDALVLPGVSAAGPGAAVPAAPAVGAAPAGTVMLAPAATAAPVAPAGAISLPAAPALGASPAVPMTTTVTGTRHLMQTKLPTSADSLLLPTTFKGAVGKKDGTAVISGPVMVVDGVAVELASAAGIPVVSITSACAGTILHVDAVPLPCNLLGRKAVVRAVAPPPAPLVIPMTISSALVNVTDVPGAVPNVTTAKSAVAALVPLLFGTLAAPLLAVLLL